MNGDFIMISIPLSKPLIGKEEITAVTKVLESGNLVQGKVTEEFEKRLASYCGYKYAVATSNGTTALHVALAAYGVASGEVIVPDFTFISTANAPRFVNAKPVFVDVDCTTFNILAQSVKKLVTPRTKAIIPVSLYGLPYDVDAVKEVTLGMPIISDNCQAIGAKYKGKRNFGDNCAVLSFYPTKNITTGEGGAILTDNVELADKCKLIRNHGMRNRYEYVTMGYNFRMTDISAAIGIEQLKKLDAFTEKRRKNAKILSELLSGVKQVTTPIEPAGFTHVYHQYTLRVLNSSRDSLKQHLEKKGIGSAVYYPAPLHSLEIFASEKTDNCVNTAQLCREVLSLPVNPLLTEEDLHLVVDTVRSFFVRM